MDVLIKKQVKLQNYFEDIFWLSNFRLSTLYQKDNFKMNNGGKPTRGVVKSTNLSRHMLF